MLQITDLQQNTEYLTGIKGLKRKRKANGDKTVDFTALQEDKNNHSYNLVQEESTFDFDGETYIIKKIKEKGTGTKTTKQVSATHKFFDDMNNHYIYDSLTLTQTFGDVLNFIFKDTPYNYVVLDEFQNKDVGDAFGDSYGLKLFKKALELFGSEFRLEGNTVYLEVEIGSKTDIQFRYGYNVKSIDREVDTKNLTTYVKGFGDGIQSEYTSPNADLYGIIPAEPVRDDRITTMETLKQRMKEKINDTPDLKLKVDVAFIDGNVEEGDYLFVIYEPMNNLDIEVRVMEVEEQFDFNLSPIQTNVTLASLNKDVTNTIVQFNETSKRVDKAISEGGQVRTSVLDGPIDTMVNQLRASGSYQNAQVREDQGYLLENNDASSASYGAMYIGPGLFAIANERDNDGNWIWRSFGDGNGFTADQMIAGTMLFDRLKGGYLRLGGSGNGNGLGELYDENDNLILRFNQKGIEMFNGSQLIGNGGVLSTFSFVSSGQFSGWQELGRSRIGHDDTNKKTMIAFNIPDNFTITEAKLTLHSAPFIELDENGNVVAYNHASNIRIYKTATLNGARLMGHLDVWYDYTTTGTNITSSVWGSEWSPTKNSNVQSKEGDITNHVNNGDNVFYAYSNHSSDYGLGYLIVTVTGYQQ